MKKPRIVEKEITSEGQKLFGLCNYENRTIYIHPAQGKKEHLDTVIHELLHFYLPKLKEKTVFVTAAAIADVLWKLRYRRRTKS